MLGIFYHIHRCYCYFKRPGQHFAKRNPGPVFSKAPLTCDSVLQPPRQAHTGIRGSAVRGPNPGSSESPLRTLGSKKTALEENKEGKHLDSGTDSRLLNPAGCMWKCVLPHSPLGAPHTQNSEPSFQGPRIHNPGTSPAEPTSVLPPVRTRTSSLPAVRPRTLNAFPDQHIYIPNCSFNSRPQTPISNISDPKFWSLSPALLPSVFSPGVFVPDTVHIQPERQCV